MSHGPEGRERSLGRAQFRQLLLAAILPCFCPKNYHSPFPLQNNRRFYSSDGGKLTLLHVVILDDQVPQMALHYHSLRPSYFLSPTFERKYPCTLAIMLRQSRQHWFFRPQECLANSRPLRQARLPRHMTRSFDLLRLVGKKEKIEIYLRENRTLRTRK